MGKNQTAFKATYHAYSNTQRHPKSRFKNTKKVHLTRAHLARLLVLQRAVQLGLFQLALALALERSGELWVNLSSRLG
jgi:hypothetical protein